MSREPKIHISTSDSPPHVVGICGVWASVGCVINRIFVNSNPGVVTCKRCLAIYHRQIVGLSERWKPTQEDMDMITAVHDQLIDLEASGEITKDHVDAMRVIADELGLP